MARLGQDQSLEQVRELLRSLWSSVHGTSLRLSRITSLAIIIRVLNHVKYRQRAWNQIITLCFLLGGIQSESQSHLSLLTWSSPHIDFISFVSDHSLVKGEVGGTEEQALTFVDSSSEIFPILNNRVPNELDPRDSQYFLPRSQNPSEQRWPRRWSKGDADCSWYKGGQFCRH